MFGAAACGGGDGLGRAAVASSPIRKRRFGSGTGLSSMQCENLSACRPFLRRTGRVRRIALRCSSDRRHTGAFRCICVSGSSAAGTHGVAVRMRPKPEGWGCLRERSRANPFRNRRFPFDGEVLPDCSGGKDDDAAKRAGCRFGPVVGRKMRRSSDVSFLRRRAGLRFVSLSWKTGEERTCRNSSEPHRHRGSAALRTR